MSEYTANVGMVKGVLKMDFFICFVSSKCWNWCEQPYRVTLHNYTCKIITLKKGMADCLYFACIQCYNVTYSSAVLCKKLDQKHCKKI